MRHPFAITPLAATSCTPAFAPRTPESPAISTIPFDVDPFSPVIVTSPAAGDANDPEAQSPSAGVAGSAVGEGATDAEGVALEGRGAVLSGSATHPASTVAATATATAKTTRAGRRDRMLTRTG